MEEDLARESKKRRASESSSEEESGDEESEYVDESSGEEEEESSEEEEEESSEEEEMSEDALLKGVITQDRKSWVLESMYMSARLIGTGEDERVLTGPAGTFASKMAKTTCVVLSIDPPRDVGEQCLCRITFSVPPSDERWSADMHFIAELAHELLMRQYKLSMIGVSNRFPISS
jgi:hypothetical protein